MKKLIGYILIFTVLILIIPILGIESGQTATEQQPNSPPNTNTNAQVDTPSEALTGTIYSVLDHKTGEILTLTPLQYVCGVVAAEMPIEFSPEALSAQAVAAHTYALRQIGEEQIAKTPDLKGAYLTTDYKRNQAYISDADLKAKWGDNYLINIKKLTSAVEPVINKIIVVDGKPIIAAFHSLSGGTTESAKNVWGQEVPYLVPVLSEGDKLSPTYQTKTVLTSQEVSNALKSAHPDISFDMDKTKWFEILERTESGNITALKAGSIELTGRELRELLQLKSAYFTISFADGAFTFDTVGYGHGVGMSQYGADFLARQGKTYTEILKHYYSGVEIVDMPV